MDRRTDGFAITVWHSACIGMLTCDEKFVVICNWLNFFARDVLTITSNTTTTLDRQIMRKVKVLTVCKIMQ